MFTVLLLGVGIWVWCWGVLCRHDVDTGFHDSWSCVSNVKMEDTYVNMQARTEHGYL